MTIGTLARKLRTFDYFTLAFGTMVGAGWLVILDDWLARGGPAGAMLGFALGALLLTPIGYVYSRLVTLMPDTSSEVAYTTRVFSSRVGFLTGWMMTLAYLIVCPWEVLAIGKIAAYLFPALNRFPLYEAGGKPVYLPTLVLGLGLAVVLTYINYRGIQVAARLQNGATIGFLLLFAVFVIVAGARGSAQNMAPAFHGSTWISVLLVLQIVPYWMTGFEAVPKCAEESRPGFPARHFGRAIYMALFVGGAFYVLVIAVVAYVAPWQQLLGKRFAMALAFETATGSRLLVNLIFACALVSLVKVFNGNFVASSRLLFGLGRAGLVEPRLGRIHPRNQTPFVAVLLVGGISMVTALLGDNLLIAVTEVGSLASAVGWLASSAAFFRLAQPGRERVIAATGALVAFTFVVLKLLPWVPGHFSRGEYISLGAWLALGLVLRARAARRSEHVQAESSAAL